MPPAIREMLGPAPQQNNDLARACETIIQLQAERHRGDYDLSSPVLKLEARRLIEDARAAVDLLRGFARSPERTSFFLGCLFGEQLKRNP